MKKFKLNILALAALFIVSCDSDDLTNDGTRESSFPTASLELNFDTNTIYDEGSQNVLSYTISLDKPQIVDIIVDISVVDGTATSGSDFTFENKVIIPANQMSATGTISIISDIVFEPNETATFKVGTGNTPNVTFAPVEFTITIGNFSENDLTIDLKWDGSFIGAGGVTDFCDVDMDLELLDSNGNYVDTSYSDCPEQIIMSATMPDDTYTLVISLWDNNGETTVVDIPANLDIYKVGSQTTYSGDISTYFPLQSGGLVNGNNNAYIEYTIVKLGNIFTVSDNNSNQVLQGRISNISSSVKAKILNKNKK